MAVYQFQLSAIPRASVVAKYGDIPSKLHIDHEGWANYWNNADTRSDEEPDFEDALTMKWWENVSVIAQEVVERIDKLIPRGDLGSDDFISWKGDTRIKEDNDAHLTLDLTTGKVIGFGFRIDLRDPDKFPQFLRDMLDIALEDDLLVMDANGVLVEPIIKDVGPLILNSKAVSFLLDPEEFLKNISTD